MALINAELSIGFAGAIRLEQLDVPDDATDEDIYEIVRLWSEDYINTYWSRADTESD